jgi:exonuclease SbcD
MNPDFIITSDIHSRESNPISRIDNYFETFKSKILWLREIQRQYGNIPILDGGDLLESWKSTPAVESFLIEYLPQPFYTVPGNHEMPYHNVNHFDKSSLNVLVKAGKVKLLNNKQPTEINGIDIYGLNYGQETSDYIISKNKKRILVMHEMVTEEKTKLFESSTPEEILNKYPQFDLIICGHNHKRFVEWIDHRCFLSPGSLMRMDSDQIDYKPNIYAVYLDKNRIESIPVPIEKNVFDVKAIKIRKQKDKRVEKFVNSLSTNYNIDISFEKNMERSIKENNIRNGVREEITLAMEE